MEKLKNKLKRNEVLYQILVAKPGSGKSVGRRSDELGVLSLYLLSICQNNFLTFRNSHL